MGKIGGQLVKAPNDADFVSIWTKWSAMGVFANAQIYCWSGIQDPTIGQVEGQPAGTTRWGAYGYGYLSVKDNTSATVGVEKFIISAQGIGSVPADIAGIPGIITLSVSGILPQFLPF